MTKFVVVGAGQAGRGAAEALRKGAPDASICIVGDEPYLPYDRPCLSKEALLDAESESKAFVRDKHFYAGAQIDLRLGARASAIDRHGKTLVLSDGQRLAYDRLLIATGSRVRRLEGEHVHYLRTLDDARALRGRLAPGTRLGIVGGGFIGLEVAASAVRHGCRVTVIEPADRLLKRAMPEVVSHHVHRLHARHGVDLRLGMLVRGVEAHDNGALRLVTNAGQIEVDVVVAGIGVVPNTDLARDAGLEVDDGIVVDEYCRTSDPDIFAAGEVTRHPIPALERRARVESWQVAERQPAVAAANMLGGTERYVEVPWLWSDQYDVNVQTLGFFESSHTILVRGNVSDGAFSVLGLDPANRLRAAATINNGRDMAALMRLLHAGNLDPALLADPDVSLRSLLRR